MPTEDIVFEEVVERVSDVYGLCVEKAKKMFTEESAIQSASATMFINATKEKSSVDAYLRTLKEKIAKTNSEAIPSAIEVWKWHFRAYISEFGPRITSAIHFYLSQNMSCEELEAHVTDRYLRLKEAQKPVDGKDEPAEPTSEEEKPNEPQAEPQSKIPMALVENDDNYHSMEADWSSEMDYADGYL